MACVSFTYACSVLATSLPILGAWFLTSASVWFFMRHGERFLYSYALRTSIIDSDDNCRSHSCCAPPSTVGQVDCGGRWSGESVPYSEEVRPEGFAFKTRLPFAVGTSREPICELATDTPDSSQALLLLLLKYGHACGGVRGTLEASTFHEVDAFPQSTQRLY